MIRTVRRPAGPGMRRPLPCSRVAASSRSDWASTSVSRQLRAPTTGGTCVRVTSAAPNMRWTPLPAPRAARAWQRWRSLRGAASWRAIRASAPISAAGRAALRRRCQRKTDRKLPDSQRASAACGRESKARAEGTNRARSKRWQGTSRYATLIWDTPPRGASILGGCPNPSAFTSSA